MTTAENISFTPSLYFRYTYTIRTPKESRRAGAAEPFQPFYTSQPSQLVIQKIPKK